MSVISWIFHFALFFDIAVITIDSVCRLWLDLVVFVEGQRNMIFILLVRKSFISFWKEKDLVIEAFQRVFWTFKVIEILTLNVVIPLRTNILSHGVTISHLCFNTIIIPTLFIAYYSHVHFLLLCKSHKFDNYIIILLSKSRLLNLILLFLMHDI